MTGFAAEQAKNKKKNEPNQATPLDDKYRSNWLFIYLFIYTRQRVLIATCMAYVWHYDVHTVTLSSIACCKQARHHSIGLDAHCKLETFSLAHWTDCSLARLIEYRPVFTLVFIEVCINLKQCWLAFSFLNRLGEEHPKRHYLYSYLSNVLARSFLAPSFLLLSPTSICSCGRVLKSIGKEVCVPPSRVSKSKMKHFSHEKAIKRSF